MSEANVTVKFKIDTSELERQLAVIRLLFSQMGFAIDNALLQLPTDEKAASDGQDA